MDFHQKKEVLYSQNWPKILAKKCPFLDISLVTSLGHITRDIFFGPRKVDFFYGAHWFCYIHL
jgi:hypothetical protein